MVLNARAKVDQVLLSCKLRAITLRRGRAVKIESQTMPRECELALLEGNGLISSVTFVTFLLLIHSHFLLVGLLLAEHALRSFTS